MLIEGRQLEQMSLLTRSSFLPQSKRSRAQFEADARESLQNPTNEYLEAKLKAQEDLPRSGLEA